MGMRHCRAILSYTHDCEKLNCSQTVLYQNCLEPNFRAMVFKNSGDIDPSEDLSILSKEGLENRKIMQQLLEERVSFRSQNQSIKFQAF